MRISDWRSDVCSSDLDTPEHNAFVKAYQAKYDDYPRLGSLVGYNTILSIAAAIEKAGSTETEAIVDAFKGLQLDTPLGPITYRALDHQSTMGAWVGKTAVTDGKGVMVDWSYEEGDDYMPSVAVVRSEEVSVGEAGVSLCRYRG